MNLLFTTLATFVSFDSYFLVSRVLLTWFPTINWYNQPFAALAQISDPYLTLFRSIIPPLGGMDFSPIFAFLALNFIGALLRNLTALSFAQPF